MTTFRYYDRTPGLRDSIQEFETLILKFTCCNLLHTYPYSHGHIAMSSAPAGGQAETLQKAIAHLAYSFYPQDALEANYA